MGASAFEPTNFIPSAVSTELIGFPTVVPGLPANSNPTGFGFVPGGGWVTIREPESPGALKVLELIRTCLTNIAVFVPIPQRPHPQTVPRPLMHPIFPVFLPLVRPSF